MITSTRVTSGYALKLPALADRTFDLTPGLNVFFGPNGCGKTSLLKITAAHVGCGEYGWSAPAKRLYDRVGVHALPYPDVYASEAPGGCRATVPWDGVPALHLATEFKMGGQLSSDSSEFTEQLAVVMSKPSSGQLTQHLVGKILNRLKNPPDLTDVRKLQWRADGEINYDTVNSTWMGWMDELVAYVRSLPAVTPADRRVTVFLDEPDRSLALPIQALLWSKILPRLAQTTQVIVATHSPFALVAPHATLHDFEAGYAALTRAELCRAFGAP